MPLASELRPGMTIALEGTLYRVVEAVHHAGTAQQKGVVHARLRNLRTGVVADRRFRPEERLEEVALERRTMEYLYNDGEMFYFMDPDTYDQVPIPAAMIGDLEIFLQPNQRALWPAREAGRPARLRLRAFPFCVPGQVQRIAVVFNGRPLGEGAFPDCGEHEIWWAIPGAWVRRMNEFVFRFAYAAVPPHGDLRRLAVGVRALEVKEGPPGDNMGGEGSLPGNPSSR